MTERGDVSELEEGPKPARRPSSRAGLPEGVALPEARGKDEVTVVFSGMSGAGKSTLISTIVLGIPADIDPSPNPVSMECEKHTKTKNNVTLTIIDTPGLIGSREERKKQIKSIVDYTKRNVDLLVYCLSVQKGTRFCNSNPDIMKSLQEAFGPTIWKHCTVLLTFSNEIWGHFSRIPHNNNPLNDSFDRYKKYIHTFATAFGEELHNLGVTQIEVKTSFDAKPLRREGQSTIVAVPTGFFKEDMVLYGQKDAEANGWVHVALQEMINSCRDERKAAFQQYRDGKNWDKAKLGVAAAAVGGAAVGGVVGGVVGGPAGAAVGLNLGAKGGGVIGAVGGGGMCMLAGYKMLRSSEEAESKETGSQKRLNENKKKSNSKNKKKD